MFITLAIVYSRCSIYSGIQIMGQPACYLNNVVAGSICAGRLSCLIIQQQLQVYISIWLLQLKHSQLGQVSFLCFIFCNLLCLENLVQLISLCINYQALGSVNQFSKFLRLLRGPQCAPPPPFCWGGGVKPPTKLLEGGCWERGGDFFQEGCNFHIKNKLKSEIFIDKKKFISKNIFLCHN